MSVMSLLITQSCAEVKAAWQSADFEKLDISFMRDDAKRETAGLLHFHGISFTFDIQIMPQLDVAKFIFCQPDISKIQSAIHFDFGPAVRGGNRIPAIVKVLMQLGEVLGQSISAKAVFWWPSSTCSGFDYFAEAVRQYGEGAAFPALLCVDFDTSEANIVRSRGLGWLCGQELAFQHAPLPSNIAMRYMVRLVHDLATKGPIEQSCDAPGMAPGETVLLKPDLHNKVLSARLVTTT